MGTIQFYVTSKKKKKFIKKIIDICKYRWKCFPEILELNKYSKIKNVNGDIVILDSEGEYTLSKNLWKEKLIYRDYLRGDGGLILLNIDENENLEKEFPYINKHFFSKVSSNAKYGVYYFPYTFFCRSNGFGDIDEFGFRLPINWKKLKNRSSNTKLITMFGGSCCFDVYAKIGERISDFLELFLNKRSKKFKYKVLNFGISGHIIENEIITYILFAWELFPDIVISHGGYNDLINRQVSDIFLLHKYNLAYCKFYEEWGVKINNFKGKIKTISQKTLFPVIPPWSVIDSYINQILLFKNIIENSKSAKFIFGLQPLVYHKKAFSNREKKTLNIENKKYKKLEENLLLIYDKFIKKLYKENFFTFIPFPEFFEKYGSELTLFLDKVHTTPTCNKIIAEIYADKILKIFNDSK